MGHLERHDHAYMFYVPCVQPGYRYMGHLERHDHGEHVRPTRAFNQDIGTWDYLERHDHDRMFYDARPFNADIGAWDTSSVTTMEQMFCNTGRSISTYRDGTSARSRHDGVVLANLAFNTMPVGWDTSKVTNKIFIFECNRMAARFEGGDDNTLPSGWTRIDNACDASYPPLNGAVGTCTDTLVSGTSCVPTCNTGFVLEGVTSCTDRVLTEVAVCTLDVTTRAELKAAVDACVGDRLCELTMPHWDVSRVTDMSFLFQGMSQFNVDISQWEMSQVTTAAGMFEGAASFYRDLSGWTFADNANTTGMFTGADTWLAVKSRTDGFDSTDGPPGAWVFNKCLENERVENGLCAPCTGGGTNAAGDDPAARCRHRMRVSRPCCAEGRGGQLHRRRSHRRGVLQPRRGLRRRGDGRDAGLGRVAGDEHERAVLWQGAVQRGYIAMGHLERHDHVQDVQRSHQRVQPRYRCMGHLASHEHVRDVPQRRRVQPAPIEMGRQLGHGHEVMFWTPTHSTRCRWAGTHPKSRILIHILFCRRMECEVHGRQPNTLPSGWTRIDDACDASLPPVNGAVGNCTDTLVSGTSCVPTCDAGYVLKGVTSCTDRVLTEGLRAYLAFTDGAELKATVDACLDAVPSGEMCCSSDRLCWHPDPAMRRCGAVGCVDMPDWDVSQVTNMSQLFHAADAFRPADRASGLCRR